jgi:hypothetical protein
MAIWTITETEPGRFQLSQDRTTKLTDAPEAVLETYLRRNVESGDKVIRVDEDGYRVRDTGYGRRRHWRE